ncbi:MAG: DUF3127 domain-containing protein [Rikenellaceae bacterium]|jgi:hypothetical protein
MAIEITGKLIKKLPLQSGSSPRGEWKKQEFIIETQENYPKKICMSVWGDDGVSDIERHSEGDLLKLSVNIESREYNQRWYTDVRAWRIEKLSGENTDNSPHYNSQPERQKSSQVSNSENYDSDTEIDDLPF